MAEQESGTAAAEPAKAATLGESEWREREGERFDIGEWRSVPDIFRPTR